MKHVILFLIKGYKIGLSPILGSHCRFFPTCSDYTHGAIQKHGLWKGILMGTRRLLKCHPFHPGGVDLVP